MLAISGKPYDTLDEVIGIKENASSLKSAVVEAQDAIVDIVKVTTTELSEQAKANADMLFSQLLSTEDTLKKHVTETVLSAQYVIVEESRKNTDIIASKLSDVQDNIKHVIADSTTSLTEKIYAAQDALKEIVLVSEERLAEQAKVNAEAMQFAINKENQRININDAIIGLSFINKRRRGWKPISNVIFRGILMNK